MAERKGVEKVVSLVSNTVASKVVSLEFETAALMVDWRAVY
jgi:hypothetical protein